MPKSPSTHHIPVFFLATATLLLSVTAARADILYVSTRFGAIDQVAPDGTVTPFAQLTDGLFGVAGIAFDPSGNLFAENVNTRQIIEISPSGSSTVFTNLPAISLAFDSAGNLYVAQHAERIIDKITPDGSITIFGNLPADFNSDGLAFDSHGNLFASDDFLGRIAEITPTGQTSIFYTENLARPEGLAFDSSDNLYITEPTSNLSRAQITKVSPDGTPSIFAILPSTYAPTGLAFDSSGNLYVADAGANQISVFNPDGQIINTFATGITEPEFLAFAPAPEPASFSFLAAATLPLLFRRRRKSPNTESHREAQSLTE